MKRLLYLPVIALLLLAGCKAKEVIRYVPVEVPVITERIDSVTIERTDSIFIKQRNDTVFYERFKTLYKDRIKIERDTITKLVTKDVPYEVEKIVYVKKDDWVRRIGIGALYLLGTAFVFFGIKLYLWIRKRFTPI